MGNFWRHPIATFQRGGLTSQLICNFKGSWNIVAASAFFGAAATTSPLSGNSQSSLSSFSTINAHGVLSGASVQGVQAQSQVNGRTQTSGNAKVSSINYASGYAKMAASGFFTSSLYGFAPLAGRGALSGRTVATSQVQSSINGRAAAAGGTWTDSLNSFSALYGRTSASGLFSSAMIDFANAGARIALSGRTASSLEVFALVRQSLVTSPVFGRFFTSSQLQALISGRGALNAAGRSSLNSFATLQARASLSGSSRSELLSWSGIAARMRTSGIFLSGTNLYAGINGKRALNGFFIVSLPSFADISNASAPQLGRIQGRFIFSLSSMLFLPDNRQILMGRSLIKFTATENDLFVVQIDGESFINTQITESSRIKSFTDV
jgi:hypothetical protein